MLQFKLISLLRTSQKKQIIKLRYKLLNQIKINQLNIQTKFQKSRFSYLIYNLCKLYLVTLIIKRMKKKYSFNFVELEHFKNIKISDTKLEQILLQQFDLIQWYLNRTNSYSGSHNNISNIKKGRIKMKNQLSKLFYVLTYRDQQKFITKEPQNKQNDKNKSTMNPLAAEVLIIQKRINTYSKSLFSSKKQIQYLFYQKKDITLQKLQSRQFMNKLLNFDSKSSTLPMIGVQFQIKINNNNQNQMKQIQILARNNIKMIVSEEIQNNSQRYPFQILNYYLNLKSENILAEPSISMKLPSTLSYLSLNQGLKILNMKCSQSKGSNNQRKYEFIFRNFNRMVNKNEYEDLVFEYANKVKAVLKGHHKNRENQLNSNQNENMPSQKSPISHFICSASNSFVSFVLSLSGCLSSENQTSILKRYTQLLFPSYDYLFKTNRKGTAQINLSQAKMQQIKKTIKFIINKLILQYSKQITLMAKQLSFIFQIVQLLNNSMVTNQFVSKVFSLLTLYGGQYPEILLKADEWFQQIKQSVNSTQNTASNRQKFREQSQTSISDDFWCSLNKMLAPGLLTRFKHKIKHLIRQILYELKITQNNQFTFEQHYKITQNAFTIVAFDLSCHTVRFFNYLTTPKLNILDFLYLNEHYQCFQITNSWVSYKIVYENQTFLVNLKDSLITQPIGIQFLQQYLDNSEVRKRYFNFCNNSTQHDKKWLKYVFTGKSKSDQVYDDRLRQFREKRRFIVSQIKKIAVNNIPKTKLIWRIIKFKKPQGKENQSPINILKKIQIINHIYHLIKTLKSNDKNLNRQVWLQSQLNLLDQVKKTSKKDYIEEGKQAGRINWELDRLKYMKSIVLDQNLDKNQSQSNRQIAIDTKNTYQDNGVTKQSESKLNCFSQSLNYNILTPIQINFPSLSVFSQTQTKCICGGVKLRLQSWLKGLELYECSNKNSRHKQTLDKLIDIIKKGLNQFNSRYNISFDAFSSAYQSIQSQMKLLIDFVKTSLVDRIKQFQQSQQSNQIKKLFDEIKTYEENLVQSIFNQAIRKINQSRNFYQGIKTYKNNANISQRRSSNGNDSKTSEWFVIQQNYHQFIQYFLHFLSQSITFKSKQIKIKLYFEVGLTQFQTYDIFLDNFNLIQQKINQTFFSNFNYHKYSTSHSKNSKINICLDSMGNSELYSELYLKLLFQKIQKLQGSRNSLNSHFESQLQIQPENFLLNSKKEANTQFSLQKYFQSFSCSSYQSITVLQLILKNNFYQNNLNSLNFQQIIKKLSSLKHLLVWTNQFDVQSVFNDFHWHLIEQQIARQFYQEVYNSDYKQQIEQNSSIQKQKISQIDSLLKKAGDSADKKVKKSIFFQERKKVQGILAYEILEQWIQTKKRAKTQNKQSSQINLNQIINKKIAYHSKMLEQYSALEKQDIIKLLTKFIEQFSQIIQQLIFISMDSIPHSSNEWKAILIKNALSAYHLKNYVIDLLESYKIDKNITFNEFHNLSYQKFDGQFNIILWNCRRQSLQICNYITKPSMPIWLAVVSACSFTFYMRERYSHRKWQNPANQCKMYSSFRQFSHSKNNINDPRLTLESYKDIVIKKTDSQIIQQQIVQQQLNKQFEKKGRKIKSEQMPPLIDQQINKYLNPNILQCYPLLYLTNPHFGMIKNAQQSNNRIICLSFEKSEQGICDRFKKPFLQGQNNFSLVDAFSLFLNKKDKHIKALRHYLRKSMKQTHFYYFGKALFEGNFNLYRNYKKAYKKTQNFEISEQSKQTDSQYSSRSSQNENNIEQQISKSQSTETKQFKTIKLSQLQEQKIDDYGDIIDLNQNKIENDYKFYVSYSKAKFKEQKLQSQRNLVVQFQNQIQINKKTKQIKQIGQQQTAQKGFFRKYFLSCLCFNSSAVANPRINKN